MIVCFPNESSSIIKYCLNFLSLFGLGAPPSPIKSKSSYSVLLLTICCSYLSEHPAIVVISMWKQADSLLKTGPSTLKVSLAQFWVKSSLLQIEHFQVSLELLNIKETWDSIWHHQAHYIKIYEQLHQKPLSVSCTETDLFWHKRYMAGCSLRLMRRPWRFLLDFFFNEIIPVSCCLIPEKGAGFPGHPAICQQKLICPSILPPDLC